MPATGLFVLQDPSFTATTIIQMNDRIARLDFPRVQGKWSLDYKLFIENPAMLRTPPSSSSQAPRPRQLSQLSLSQHRDDIFCLIDESPNYTSRSASGNLKKVLAVFDRGIDSIIGVKLHSLWVQRQAMRADGFIFAFGEEFTVRTGNVTQGGLFKFIIVEVEYLLSDNLEEAKPHILSLIDKCNLPPGKFYYGDKVDIHREEGQDLNTWTKLTNSLQYMEIFRSRESP
ncbi:mediator complex, subunit Med20 [Lipomyces oligophaga]|uniref:mediator complex, subunit Med20 n=1 Tax=Lipomyces oligophaga TaxID=45792 RepID=UPI0034CD1E6D